MMGERPFYGKYRGQVTQNQDQEGLGRVRATVVEVYGANDSPWALPSVPYAGDQVGMMLIPAVGAWVWVEFEHGDPESPIWSGCFWERGQTRPFPASTDTTKILKTDTVTITIDDSQSGQGSIKIETTAGAVVTIQGQSITLDNGSSATVGLSGSTVQLNNTALQVT